MSKQFSKFVADGWRRLSRDPKYREQQAALEAKIREKYSAELSAATSYWQRVEIETKIRREIKKSKSSPYTLWSSAGVRF
jgi:hypothetical protein